MVQFSTFRPFTNGNEIYYLLLLPKSFISENPNEKGILSKWNLSKNGSVFHAIVSSSAKWQDGTTLSAKDAALSIAKGFTYRPVGKKIKIINSETLDAADWKTRNHPGIKIISDNEFKIYFESKIENLKGTIIEALQTNSRHNRVWPTRISKLSGEIYPEAKFDLISKYPIKKLKNEYVLNIHGHNIRLTKNCNKTDFYPTHLPINKKRDKFSMSFSNHPQSLVGLMNKFKNAELSQRLFITNFMRNCFDSFTSEIIVTDAHFTKKEAGFGSNISWPKKFPKRDKKYSTPLSKLNIGIGINIPKNHIIRKQLRHCSSINRIKLNWYFIPSKTHNAAKKYSEQKFPREKAPNLS